MATKSASNIAEMKPVAAAAKANVTGANGAAFADWLGKYLTDNAEAVVKAGESLKGQVKKFYNFSDEDFTGFLSGTKAKRAEIKAEADKVKLTVTQLRQSNPRLDYVYVNLSIFDTLARAVQTGWRPELDRLSWNAIKAQAKERLDANAAAAKQADIVKQIAGIEADPQMDEEEKKARVVVLKKEMEKAAMVKPRSGQGTTTETKSDFQKECERLDKMSYDDLTLIRAWLDKKIEALDAARPGIKSMTGIDPAQVENTRKTGGKRAAQTRLNETKEHAAAHSGKAKAKKSRK